VVLVNPDINPVAAAAGAQVATAIMAAGALVIGAKEPVVVLVRVARAAAIPVEDKAATTGAAGVGVAAAEQHRVEMVWFESFGQELRVHSHQQMLVNKVKKYNEHKFIHSNSEWYYG